MIEKPTLYLFRGIPGAGKSTYASKFAIEKLGTDKNLFEADQFHIDPKTNKYEFSKEVIEYAHMHCLSSAAKTLHWGEDAFVANTFTKWWEIQRYMDVALATNSDVVIIHCLGNFSNIHDVPEETLEKMNNRFESNRVVYGRLRETGKYINLAILFEEYQPETKETKNPIRYYKKVDIYA